MTDKPVPICDQLQFLRECYLVSKYAYDRAEEVGQVEKMQRSERAMKCLAATIQTLEGLEQAKKIGESLDSDVRANGLRA